MCGSFVGSGLSETSLLAGGEAELDSRFSRLMGSFCGSGVAGLEWEAGARARGGEDALPPPP